MTFKTKLSKISFLFSIILFYIQNPTPTFLCSKPYLYYTLNFLLAFFLVALGFWHQKYKLVRCYSLTLLRQENICIWGVFRMFILLVYVYKVLDKVSLLSNLWVLLIGVTSLDARHSNYRVNDKT